MAIHREAQIDHAFLTPELCEAGIALEPLQSREQQPPCQVRTASVGGAAAAGLGADAATLATGGASTCGGAINVGAGGSSFGSTFGVSW